LNETVIIDGCDSCATNHLDSKGCTIIDQIAECAAGAKNHGDFVSCVAHLTNRLRKESVINANEKGAIQNCAAKANLR